MFRIGFEVLFMETFSPTAITEKWFLNDSIALNDSEVLNDTCFNRLFP